MGTHCLRVIFRCDDPVQSVQSVQGEAGVECSLELVLCSITHVNINYTNKQTQLSQRSMDGF